MPGVTSPLATLLTPERCLLLLDPVVAAAGPALGAGLSRWVSGVVVPPAALAGFPGDGPLPGVRMDTGTAALPLGRGATVSEGLDGLSRRLDALAEHGARFAYWRAVLDAERYSGAAVHANTHALARFAGACQEADLPALLDLRVGTTTHGIAVHEALVTNALEKLDAELTRAGVAPANLILVTGLVRHGTPAEVAERTVRALGAAPRTAGIALAVDAAGRTNLRAVAERAARYLDSSATLTFCVDDPGLAEQALA
ncbi:class I fructose-bisphosphate aldolase [Cryptosporangium sp. NPDC051539]|uniref:class I fructose-bisphosphate aldolase n=1 Tax=Cryptosporangium sp. NPDC051539 TaxID=3363962 RepID=UPI00378CCCAF